MLYAEQLRAARALLRWEQSALAAAARISVETVKRLERLDGPLVAVKVATVEAIRKAFEAAGIEFIDPEEGVRGPGLAFKWGVSAKAGRAGYEEGDGDGSGGLKAREGAEAIADYWRTHAQEWAALSQSGRNVLSVEIFGFPEGGDEAFGA